MASIGTLTIGLVATTWARGTRERDDAIPFAARHAVDQQMIGHGGDLAGLVQSAVLLNFTVIESRARALVDAKLIPRPAPGERNTLSASIPPRFFDLQDRLKVHATALAGAARRRDARAVSDEIGQTVQACVDCHAAYLWTTATGERR